MIERVGWTGQPFYNGWAVNGRAICRLADEAVDRVEVDAVRCGAGQSGPLDQRSRQLMTFMQFGLDALRFRARRPGYQGHSYGQDGLATIELHPNLPGT
jgi:hypothetical protein